jgi:DNA-binding LacI/PurR family transcriptional regulator
VGICAQIGGLMKPLHHVVRETLLARIRQLPPETRLPGDRDLAREYNVAFMTLNKVMLELAREGYLVRRPRQGTFVASHARTVAATPVVGSEGSIFFAYPQYFSHHYFRHLQLAARLAAAQRLRLVEFRITPDTTADQLTAAVRAQADVRGVMLLPLPAVLTPAALSELDSLERPVVLLSCSVDIAATRYLTAFDLDWQEVGRLAAQTFLAAGHRRIAWLNHEASGGDAIARGMREALKTAGLRGGDLLTYGNGTTTWGDARATALQLVERLLDEGQATAAFCDNVAGARSALLALWRRGLPAPGHLSLIANGMQSGDEDYVAPPLSTIDADWEGEMERAFAVLLGGSSTLERRHVVPVRLAARASVVAPRGP